MKVEVDQFWVWDFMFVEQQVVFDQGVGDQVEFYVFQVYFQVDQIDGVELFVNYLFFGIDCFVVEKYGYIWLVRLMMCVSFLSEVVLFSMWCRLLLVSVLNFCCSVWLWIL